ncbi:MAG: DUF47 domain-containing protein [Fibrobacterota bacterium]
MFGKRHKAFIREIDLFLETLHAGHRVFIEAMDHFQHHGTGAEFRHKAAEVTRYEKEADRSVKEIKNHLYEGFLLPDSREDIALLADTFDDTLDIAEDVIRYIQSRRLAPLAQTAENFTALVRNETGCFEKTKETVSLIFRHRNQDRIRTAVQEIGDLETICDDSEYAIITEIYRSAPSDIRYELAELTEKVSSIADACEDTAAIINIINIKRVI